MPFWLWLCTAVFVDDQAAFMVPCSSYVEFQLVLLAVRIRGQLLARCRVSGGCAGCVERRLLGATQRARGTRDGCAQLRRICWRAADWLHLHNRQHARCAAHRLATLAACHRPQ